MKHKLGEQDHGEVQEGSPNPCSSAILNLGNESLILVVNTTSIPIDQLKSEFKSRLAFIHLVSALIPEAACKLTPNKLFSETGEWVDSAPEEEMREKAHSVLELLDGLVDVCLKRLPPKKDWREIAAEYWVRLGRKEFSFTRGWLAERFDCSSLRLSDDMPYHARIGVGHHAGNAAVEEEFLLRDAFFILAKCQITLTRLENFRGELQESLAKEQYKLVSTFNQNVATYARNAVVGFYSFVECFVNSVGEDFIARNPELSLGTCDLLRGKKDGRYLSIEKKLEMFPGLIRSDGKRPIILSDPKQISEPYKSFATQVKDIRDSSAHFATYKADIIVAPQVWEERAKDASSVCLAVARGFWTACYPGRQLPLYLGQLDDVRHSKIAEDRVKVETREFASSRC